MKPDSLAECPGPTQTPIDPSPQPPAPTPLPLPAHDCCSSSIAPSVERSRPHTATQRPVDADSPVSVTYEDAEPNVKCCASPFTRVFCSRSLPTSSPSPPFEGGATPTRPAGCGVGFHVPMCRSATAAEAAEASGTTFGAHPQRPLEPGESEAPLSCWRLLVLSRRPSTVPPPGVTLWRAISASSTKESTFPSCSHSLLLDIYSTIFPSMYPHIV